MNLTGEMTYAAMSWLRYDKNADIVCTEVGTQYLKDVCGLWIARDGLPSAMTEVEVKTSMADLKRDFSAKQKKHEWYSEGRHCPNYLYYLVPKSMAEESKTYLNEKNPRYGVLSFDAEAAIEGSQPFFAGKSITSVHKCSRLTKERPSPGYMHQMGRRLVNEYFMQLWEIRCWSDRTQDDLLSYAKAIVKRERGKVDKYCPLGEDANDSA